jgi:hypothetical protein
VLDGPSNPDASRDVVWPNCIDDSCPYMLDGGIPAAVAEAHNTLARRAEIGALVEFCVRNQTHWENEVVLCIGESDDYEEGEKPPVVACRADGEGFEKRHVAATLLDALRALAKEVGCES